MRTTPAFVDGVDDFDAEFFGLSPEQAEAIDPQERLFLEHAYGCIEDAGYSPESLRHGRVSVFVGAMKNAGSGAYPWSVANRVSFMLDLHGPSLSVDSACSSALTAVHLAIENLRNGTTDLAIVGGVNLMVNPDPLITLSGMGILGSGETCRPYDAEADGFLAGEVCAAMLLKPLERALADGDPIHAVVKGSMINNGGRTSGYTLPSRAAQAQVIRDAFASAGVEPWTITYVEGHGTGTLLGDAIEISALNEAFGDTASARGNPTIGSVKGNVGHSLNASGMTSVAKVLLQMRHGQLAPSPNADTPNPYADSGSGQVAVQRELAPWPRLRTHEAGGETELPRRSGISCFGLGGSNAPPYSRRAVGGSHRAFGGHRTSATDAPAVGEDVRAVARQIRSVGPLA